MNLKTFFEKFELFADAPDAVAKMRELILTFATTKRLLHDHSDDYEEIELSSLIAKRLSSIDPTKHPEKLYELWSVPSYADREPEILKGFEIKSSKKELPDGSLLLSKINPHLNRVWKVERKTDGELISSPEWITLIPCANWEIDFLTIVLQSPSFISSICKTARGMGSLTRANITETGKIKIPLPPLAEQKRIVAKVDALMALCDQLEAQQQARDTHQAALARASLARFADAPTPANLEGLFNLPFSKNSSLTRHPQTSSFNPHPSSLSPSSFNIHPSSLRKSILTLAVQGKLVPQDSGDEPAEEIITNARAERSELVKDKTIPKPKKLGPSKNPPFQIPQSWEWVPLGSITHLLEYGTSQKSNDDSTNIPVYRMGDIQDGSLINHKLKFVPEDIDDLPRLYLERGDILFNRTNSAELVGKAAIFRGTSNTHTFASYLIRARLPASYFDPEFINLSFRAPYFRETQINPEIIQQCGQANFNGTKLAHTLFPIPPLAEQRRIVAKVDQLMALVDELETQLAESRSAAQKLLEALVAELTAA